MMRSFLLLCECFIDEPTDISASSPATASSAHSKYTIKGAVTWSAPLPSSIRQPVTTNWTVVAVAIVCHSAAHLCSLTLTRTLLAHSYPLHTAPPVRLHTHLPRHTHTHTHSPLVRVQTNVMQRPHTGGERGSRGSVQEEGGQGEQRRRDGIVAERATKDVEGRARSKGEGVGEHVRAHEKVIRGRCVPPEPHVVGIVWGGGAGATLALFPANHHRLTRPPAPINDAEHCKEKSHPSPLNGRHKPLLLA